MASTSAAGTTAALAPLCRQRGRRGGVAPPAASARTASFGLRGIRRVAKRKSPVAAAARSGGELLPPDAVTFSTSISTDHPLDDSPEASFEEYLDDRPRIFGAMFPDRRRSWRLNEEEWRVQMLPIQFLFASVNPVVVMQLRCRSREQGYPPEVPPAGVARVLELRITRWELRGLEGGLVPPHFALGVRGLLFPVRVEGGEARRSRLRGHLEMSISLVLPPVLALVPEPILRDVAESVLRRLVERMKKKVDGSLLEDFRSFRMERLRKRISKKRIDRQPPTP